MSRSTLITAALLLLTSLFLHAQDEEPESKNQPRRLLFDLSKQKEADLEGMCIALAKGGLKPTKFSDGAIYAATSKLSIFFADFNRTIPANVKLCLEATVFLSQAKDENVESESTTKKASAIRLGFKTGGSKRKSTSEGKSIDATYAINTMFWSPKSGVRAGVLSGPHIDGGTISREEDSEAKQIIYTSKSDEASANAAEPFSIKIVADEKTKEIAVFIKDQEVFTGKSAYYGVEGDICPFDSISGFYIRFEGQNSLTDENPAYVKNVLCYYLLPES